MTALAAARPGTVRGVGAGTRWLGWTLGVAICFTTATRLRPVETLPLGPGEVLLVLWGLSALVGLAARNRLSVSRATKAFVSLWAISFATLAFGWMVGLTRGISALANVRDVAAYALSGGTFAILLLTRDPSQTMAAARKSFCQTLLPVHLGFLILTAFGRLSLGPIAYWYYDVRFSGWAQNPNQLALACLPLPFWIIGHWASSSRAWRLGLGAAIASAILVGATTRSDALILAWSIAALAGLGWMGLVAIRRGSLKRRWAGLMYFACPLVVAGLVAALGARGWAAASRKLETDYYAGDQGPVRFRRWGYALEAMSMSPLVGLGPGSFSGAGGVFEGEEAHNTLLDWTASTGVVGLVTLAFFLAYAGISVWRRGDRNGLLLLLTLGVFSSFHFVARQPVFWLTILGLLLSRPPTPAPPDRATA